MRQPPRLILKSGDARRLPRSALAADARFVRQHGVLQMKGSDYEQVVAEVVETVAKIVDGHLSGTPESGRKNRLLGASGYRHQIDVSLLNDDVKLLIECKHWARRVSPAALLAFAARVIDIAAADHNRPTIPTLVTTRDVQPGAALLAAYFGIEVMIVATVQDFAFRYRNHLVKGVPCFEIKMELGTPSIDIVDHTG